MHHKMEVTLHLNKMLLFVDGLVEILQGIGSHQEM